MPPPPWGTPPLKSQPWSTASSPQPPWTCTRMMCGRWGSWAFSGSAKGRTCPSAPPGTRPRHWGTVSSWQRPGRVSRPATLTGSVPHPTCPTLSCIYDWLPKYTTGVLVVPSTPTSASHGQLVSQRDVDVGVVHIYNRQMLRMVLLYQVRQWADAELAIWRAGKGLPCRWYDVACTAEQAAAKGGRSCYPRAGRKFFLALLNPDPAQRVTAARALELAFVC